MKEIDIHQALPMVNNYLKNYYFEKNYRLPTDIVDALKTINDECNRIFIANALENYCNAFQGSDLTTK